LSLSEAAALAQEAELHWLGQLANAVRERRHGDCAYFINNRHINYTNVCVSQCSFCAFCRAPEAADAYVLGLEGIERLGREAAAGEAVELHVVGGLHPDLPLSYYLEMLARLREAAPEVTLKAFSAVEIAHLARREGLSVEEVLRRMKEVGLGMLPGGGGEIFAERVRREVCPNKADAEAYLAVHRTAHRLGVPSNATMLYGHIETMEERLEHLVRLRELQDETGGLAAFVPLAFQPERTGLSHLPGPTGLDDLRTIALSRLMLDNVPHIKAYWVTLGPKMAQVALWYGADDLDGTIGEERVAHEAGAAAPTSMTLEELEALIVEARRKPVRRDAFYRPLNGP
jgi:aminodeoxyfutalosine synthase